MYRRKTAHVVRSLVGRPRGTGTGTGMAERERQREDDREHEADICAVLLNPKNVYQLYAVHGDGLVRLWEFQDGVVLKVRGERGSVRGRGRE